MGLLEACWVEIETRIERIRGIYANVIQCSVFWGIRVQSGVFFS